jgi:hypothetical protein
LKFMGIGNDLQLHHHHSIREIPTDAWRSLEADDFPFTDYEFLLALEESGCVGPGSGWQPHYLTLQEESAVYGCLLLYSKTDSYGEYIFDWQWADAYQRHGVPYYPKFVSAIPFTPATGSKILIDPSRGDQAGIASQLIDASLALVESAGHSSIHHLFISPEQVPLFESKGYMARSSYQFHWRNSGYASFQDFLDELKGKKRKAIQKERRECGHDGVTFCRYTGGDLTSDHAKVMHQFYLSTIGKMGAIPYLNWEFFETVFHSMPDRILLCLAEVEGEPIAGAVNFYKGKKMFGRYWGCSEERKHLHFELCYYQALEFVIEQKMQLFEAGAQGPHKFQRGFLPSPTFSAHQISHPEFRRAIAQFVEDEAVAIQQGLEQVRSNSPFKET